MPEIQDLPAELTIPVSTDYLVAVDDPTGIPVTKYLQLANVNKGALPVAAKTIIANDDVVINLGASSDIAAVNRSTILTANTVLGNVIVGTPVTAAIPANSLIVSNITADGDIVFITQTGGNSNELLRLDGSGNNIILSGNVGINTTPTLGFEVGSTGTDLTGATDFAIAGNFDLEGYGAIGNGGAPTNDRALLIDYDKVIDSGQQASLLVLSGSVFTTVDAATHDHVHSADIRQITVTDGGTSTVSNMASLYIENAPSTDVNTVSNGPYAIFVDAGDSRFDGDTFINDGAGLVVGALTQTIVAGIAPELQVIGTGSPDGSDAAIVIGRFQASNAPPVFLFTKSRGVIGAFDAVVNNDNLGQVIWYGADGTDLDTLSAGIQVFVDGTPGTGDIPTEMVLSVADGGSLVEGLRIKPSGAVAYQTSVDSAAVADQVSFGRYEIGAANTVIALSQETAVVVEVDETKFSHKMQVRLNGATYFMMLTAT